MTTVRTRIAPSPTGRDLHIGNAYTALINYVFAKKHNGKFIIRIEDTDRARLVEGSEKRILESLNWLGISHDEGPDKGGPYKPYRQSDRLSAYKKYAMELIEKGHAYWCSCTPQRLTQMRRIQEAKHEPPMYDGHCRELHLKSGATIRLKVPKEGITRFRDIIRGDISFENKLIDDQVLLKSDGFPTYHLGVVVDDHLMEISHIIRGEEWISSTPKHILLYKFFGWDIPRFAHVSVLRNPDKSKLSKRKNPVWVSDYRAKGFVPDAIKNYLATMAWSYPDGRDIFSVEEMIKEFKLEDIQTTAPVFDVEKLKWMNGKYLKEQDIATFFGDKYPEEKVKQIWPLVKDRMRLLPEFDTLAGFFFERPKVFERSLNPKLLKLLKEHISTVEWNRGSLEQAVRSIEGVKAKEIFMELRVAVTGKTVGPPLLESLEILGREETLKRIPSSGGRSRR